MNGMDGRWGLNAGEDDDEIELGGGYGGVLAAFWDTSGRAGLRITQHTQI